MLNDDDKDRNLEGQEESEYHFSDEETNYEVEPEPEKTGTAPTEAGPKVSLLNRLSQSKRMLISGAVFILLIFVVYKMVTPTTTTSPSTDIMVAQRPPTPSVMPVSPTTTAAPQAPQAAQVANQPAGAPAISAQPPMTPPLATQPPAEQPTMAKASLPPPGGTAPSPSVVTPPPQMTTTMPAPGGMAQPVMPTAAPTMPTQAPPLPAQNVAALPPPGGAPQQPATPLPTQSGAISQPGAVPPPGGTISQPTNAANAAMTQAGASISQAVATMQGVAPQAPALPPPGGAVTAPTTGYAPANPIEPVQTSREQRAAAEQAGMVNMPAVIPVQSPIPTTVATVQEPTLPRTPTALTQPGALQTPLPERAQADFVNLQAKSERLMSQLEADYANRLSEYAAQNRALQEQVQNLNAKVSGMESQLSQLLQALMRPAPPPPPQAAARMPEPVAVVEPKVTYNVQAIIPGRAWLKTLNGETVTVAEGDVVRDLGRITKIDPYDGVVEINTGNKVVALSYGNGG